MPSHANVYGTAIHTMLTIRGLLQKDLAERVGVPESTVSLWVNGKREPSAEQRSRICRVLAMQEHHFYVTPDELHETFDSFGPMFE